MKFSGRRFPAESLRRCVRHSPDIAQHLCGIVAFARPDYAEHHSDELRRQRHERLHLLQRVVLPCRVVLVELAELIVVSHQGHGRQEQHLPQPFASSSADSRPALVLA